MNDYEATNRTLKAIKLADTITHHSIPTRIVVHLDDDGWFVLCQVAKVKVASHKTRELVLAILHERDEAAPMRSMNAMLNPMNGVVARRKQHDSSTG